MLRIHFLLRQPKQKGIKAIYATVRYQGQTAILFPGWSIHTDNWINKKGINKPRDIPENNNLKDNLHQFEKLIRDTYYELKKDYTTTTVPPSLLKQVVYAKRLNEEVSNILTPKEVRILIVDFFQTLIADSRASTRMSESVKAISEQTIKTYVTTQNHFKSFQATKKRKYFIDEVNQDMIDAFSRYLTHELGMSYNSVGKYMKNMRTMLNYAKQKKLISLEVMYDMKIKVSKEATANIYLSYDEIKSMVKLGDFETPLQEVVRDLFVIGCLTGQRFSDYSTLHEARFDSAYIFKTMTKTKSDGVLPIHPIVKQILNKYPDSLPKCPSNQVFNKILKEIGKRLPELDTDFQKAITRRGKSEIRKYKKWELLQSHTARRSFCTNEYLNGTPTITIMAISGHKSEKTFMSYIKADALQHAKVLEKHWRDREKG